MGGLIVLGLAAVALGGAGALAIYERWRMPWDRFEKAMIELGVPPVRRDKRRRSEWVPRTCRGTYEGLRAGFDEGEQASPRIEVLTRMPAMASSSGPLSALEGRMWRPAPVFWVEARLDCPRFFATASLNDAVLAGGEPHPVKEGWLEPDMKPCALVDGMRVYVDNEDALKGVMSQHLQAALRSLPSDAAVSVQSPRVHVIPLRGQRVHPMSSRFGGAVRDFEAAPQLYLEAARAIAAALLTRAYR